MVSQPARGTRPFGFNVIGHVSGNLGLGVSARSIIKALLDNNFPVAVLDIDPGLGRHNYDTRFDSLKVQSAEELPFAVNFLVFPPPTLVAFISQFQAFLTDPDRFNAVLTWWELPVISPHWRAALEFFDVVVAPSGFIRSTLDLALSRSQIISAQHPLYLPDDISPHRERFGIKAEELVFVTSFEVASDPIRKNVLAVIDAFKIGLTAAPHARLLIKLHNAPKITAAHHFIDVLRKACAADQRIRIIDEPLSYAEVLSLYASSDVFVSLHRAEGLGLGPLEAMALGKVAIATAWSGNMTYMDYTNACLVPYRLVPVVGARGAYSSGELAGLAPFWAEPDIGAAAVWMTRLSQDETLRKTIGANAARAVCRLQEEAAKSKFAFEIKALWEHHRFAGLSRDLDARFDAFRSTLAASGQRNGLRAANIRKVVLELVDRHLLWRFRN